MSSAEAGLLTTGRELAGERFVLTAARFENAPPADISPLVEFFGTSNLEFNAPANGFSIARATLDVATTTGDPMLLSILEPEAKRMVDTRAARRDDWADEVRVLVAGQLDGQSPSLKKAARSLAMSPRTLQRRLEERGMTFDRLVDSVRKELAERFVAEGKLSNAEIAGRLGYRDLSQFYRAFRRWTGDTPGRARAKDA